MSSTHTAAPFAKIALAFAGIYVIWGTTYLAIALSIQTLPPFTSGGIRFLLAATLMFAWLRWREERPFAGIDMKRAALCGVLLSGFGNGLVVWAQQGIPSGIAALLVASIPIFVLIVESLFFAGSVPSPRTALGMLIAVVGVVTIVVHTHDISGTAKPIYIVAILLAVLSWSWGTVLQRHARVAAKQVVAFTCAQIFFGGLLQLSLALANGEWRSLNLDHVSLTSALAVFYLIVFGSIVALSCYSWLLTQIAAQKVATYALVNPVVAMILGAAVLSEKITATMILAALGVLLGVGLVLFPGKTLSTWKLYRSSEAA
jgi:drug/metabolite transporter (DMT)-like permease